MPLDDTIPPPFDPDKAFTSAPAPDTAPPPFDPGKPFVQAGGAPPPFDPSKPFTSATPQYTREKPLTPKTQEEIEAAPAGAWLKHPKTGELFSKPSPAPDVDTATGQELDFSSLTAAPKPPGWFGTAIEAGKKGIVSGVTESMQAPTAFRERPSEPPDTSPVGELLREPISQGLTDPKWWIAHIVHGAAASSPSLAAGAAGAVVGAAAGPVGALAGGAGGFALGSAVQTIAPAYQKARADGLDHDQAVHRAIVESGIAAGFGAVMGLAPAGVAAALTRPLSRALAEIFVVQPALGLGQMETTGAVEGKAPTLDELGTAYAEQAGMGVALSGGHAGARRLLGAPAPGQAAPGAAPSAATPAPAGAPPPMPVGSVIGMDLGRGVEPATVARHEPDGDVVLTDPEGQEHRMTGADVARLGTAAPPDEGTPRTTVTVNGKQITDTHGPVPTGEAIRAAMARGETITTPSAEWPRPVPSPEARAALDAAQNPQPAPPEARPRTQADLERETAEQRVVEARAALVGQAKPEANPIAQATAADQAELAKTPERGIPRGMGPAPAPTMATALPAVARPETPAPAAPSAGEARPTPAVAPPDIDLSGMGNAIVGNLYGGLFDALRGADNVHARMRDPVLARAKPFYDQGLIKSPQDLQALVNAEYDPARAGLIPPEPAAEAPKTWDTLAPQDFDNGATLRLYRGQTEGEREHAPGSATTGGWFTTDPAQAARYGDVSYVDIGRDDLPSFARGHGGADEFLTTNPEIIGRQRPIEPTPGAPPPYDYMAEYEANQARIAAAEPAPAGAPEGSRVPVEGDHTIIESRPEGERTTPALLGPAFVPPVEARPEPPTERPAQETPPPNTDESKNLPTATQEKHTKTGADLYAVRFPKKPDIEDLGGNARRMGGRWSSFRGGGMQPGWMFKTQEAADRFADWAREKMGAPEVPRDWVRLSPQEVINRVAATVAAGREIPADEIAHRVGVSREYAETQILPKAREIGQAVANAAEQGAAQAPEEAIRTMDEAVKNARQPPLPPPTRSTRSEQEIGRDIRKAREDTETDQSEAQIASGNYPKGKVDFHGIPFVMENPEGSIRRGTDANGQPWEVEMPIDYGYISRTEGSDGDHVDAYMGQALASQRAWVIDQTHADTGSFDEHKIMLGFNDWPTARRKYEEAFSDDRGADRIGNVTPMSLDQLKTWLKEGDTRNPIGQQALPLAEPARSPVEHPPHEVLPQVRLASAIETRLLDDAPITARELQQMAERIFEGTLAAGKFSRADLYDALELGMNRLIAAHPGYFDPHANLPRAQEIAQKLAEYKTRLPTQTVRAGEKESMQQFSTPPDYAYAVSWVANIRQHDSVLEPSAGTGSLAVHAMNAGPHDVMVNELSANRAPLVESLAPDRAFRENAEQLHNILPQDVRPTVVVMNPPFSQTAGRMGNKMVAGTGARHVEQALSRLEPGGRLVAIVGRGMRAYTGSAPSGVRFGEGTGLAFRDWWSRIAREYDVRANIGVPGEVYGKYGTTFGTQLLVIDKNPPSGRAQIIADAASIPDLMEKLDGIRNDRIPAERNAPAEQLAAQPGGEASPGGGRDITGSGIPVLGPAPEPGVRGGTGDTGAGTRLPNGPRAGGEPAVQPQPEARPGNEVAPQQPERGGPGGTERQPPEGTGIRPELAGSGAEPDAMVLRPEGRPGSVLPDGTEGGITEPGPGPEIVHVQEAAANPETAAGITENVYEPYKPQRITIKGAVEHPTALVQSAAMASVMPPEVSYVPKIPKELITGGKLSDAQLEAVIYAGHAHSQTLPTVEGETPFRRGYFIGDGTGVGKGAQVAGIILDNLLQGRKRALWLSESRTLINDARRDWKWLGRDPKEVFDVGKVAKPASDIKMGQGIGFLTYDTLKGYERQGKDEQGATIKGQTRVDQIVNWLGKDFDGVIAFDESHNLANSIATKGTRGIKDAAAKAMAGVELQQKLPNARVVYVSATGATEVMNLAYAERLGLWGRGTAFPNKNDFIGKISSGGVAAMELVARDMKAMGHYISRNLSYDGVEYDRVEHKLTPEQHAIYDGLAEGWQSVLQNIEAALIKTGVPDHDTGMPKADRRQRADALSAFWSGHQRFFNQIITSIQMPTVIRGIERDLKEGRQAVLQLVNTNEASQERAIARAMMEHGDLEDLDMTPKDQLAQMIDKSFPTQQREEYTDENDSVRTRTVVDSAGNIVHNPEALAMKDALITKVGSLSVPDGPLEMLMNHFGTDKVAEITGRKQRVVPKLDEKGQLHNERESRPGSANLTEADAFQNAKKPILVFSQAGMTGRSYHADLSSPSADARRSHYLVQAGWRADKAIQGFGRTHRTNQASAPIFHLVTTDLEGQRRFISSIARRLAQLGALTKGERRAGESGMFSARDNLESNEARAGLGQLWRDMQGARIPTIEPTDFERQTGLKLRDGNGNPSGQPEITQFLNRLLSMKFDMQNHVFGEFSGRLNTAIDRAAAAGTLDVGTETLKADRISKEEDRIVHTDPTSGAETRYVRLKVEHKSNPASFETVQRRYQPAGGAEWERAPFYVTSKRSGKTLAVVPSRDVTDASTGNIVPQYRLVDPLRYDFTDRHKIDGRDAGRYWERIDDPAEAKRRWDEQVAAIPEYTSNDTHLITGAILPIWDRLQGYPQVYRLQTDAGEKMLGRTIHDSQIDHVLKALGAEGAGRKYTPDQVAEQIMGGGRATLANGWTLRRSTVAGEPRIELTGPNYTHDAELTHAGIFTERIGYTTRYFIPTGEGAARALESVLERRPIVDMERATSQGLAEGEPTKASAPFRNTQGDFDAAVPWHPMDPQEAARQYVAQRGDETGNEHLVAYDARTGSVAHVGTSDRDNFVAFPDWGRDEAQTMIVHHNHPSGSSLSPMDLSALPHVGQVVAHGKGDIFAARVTPEYAAAVNSARGAPMLDGAANVARSYVDQALRPLVEGGQIKYDAGNAVFQDLVNRALAHAGFIDYVSTRNPEDLIGKIYAQRAMRLAVMGLNRSYGHEPFVKDLTNGFHDRSARTLRPEEGMAELSRSAEELAAGRSQGAGGDQGRGIFREEGQGLAEEPPPDLSDSAQRETIEAALRAGGPKGIGGRFYDALGSGPRSPGAGDHFFNVINKDFTTPQTKAALDPRSNLKWQAELAKKRGASAMLRGYHENLDSWQGNPAETWKKQFAAMEILTLEGREVPLDGRAIIVENRDRPLAALSKVGDVIRLTSPEEIQMFTDYRRNMDGVWKDLVAETARQFGWEGEPTSEAIRAAAEAAGGSEGRRLARAAKIVAAIEYQHRTAYLPLMRSGDYFMRVKPTRPNEAWNGEGYPPTTMFKLIDSLSPVERAMGGIREGTPRLADKEIAELRATFPEGEYTIDHGYMFRKTDALRDLDIPAIDKLMMLVGNDARGQLRDRMQRTGMDPETARRAAQDDYDKLVDTVLDQIYEQRVAGFKRTRQGVAGYDSDFAKSTGQYLGWLANHISDLRHRPDIEAADQAIESHPDPRTRQFWKEWDRRQENYGDQLYGPLAKLRQGAFYWLLGMNAATTAKIMLHGPLRGVPVLTTGLGAQGRMQAMGTYLSASRDMLKALGIGKGGIEVNFDAPGFARTLSAPERSMLAGAEQRGILHAQTADELAAVRNQGEEALTEHGRFFRRFLDIWGSNVSAADRMVRGSMMLAGYRTANRVGMETINRVWDKDLNWRNAPQKTPEGFGQFLVDKTVGIWGDVNRMPVMRSEFGGLIGQFKLYEIGYLSNLHQMLTRMGPEGKVTAAMMLGGLGMMGGAVAVPFAQDAASAVGWLYQQVSGISPDLEGDLKHAIDALIPGGGEVALHGGRPLGIDWSGIGFGEIISKNMHSPLDLFGAAASTGLGSPYRAFERYKSGQGELASIRELLPNAVKHMLDALYPEVGLTSATGASKVLSPSQLSEADRAKMALGFNPEVRALRYEQIRHDAHIQTAYRSALTAVENRIANLQDRGESTAGAQADAIRVIAKGRQAGVFTDKEVERFDADMKRKGAQRAHPEIGSKTNQRIEAAQPRP